MNRFDENIISKICALGNLTIIVDQQHNLENQTQNKTVNVRVTVTLLWGCVTNVDMENQ